MEASVTERAARGRGFFFWNIERGKGLVGASLPLAGLVRPDASRFGKDETAGPRKPRSLGAPSPVEASCFQANELISLRDGFSVSILSLIERAEAPVGP
jgi:hypothetical protein